MLRGGQKKIPGWAIYKQNPEILVQRYPDIINNHIIVPRDPFYRKDPVSGKDRRIIAPCADDLLVQHSIVLILREFFKRGMYDHTYASIPSRGTHLGSKAVRKFINNNPRKCKYYLKIDIKHFFQSIDQDYLFGELSRYIKDTRLLDKLDMIIHADEMGGLPLGYYTSHWFANWLLKSLDHYIVEKCHPGFYIRFMDDMVIFDSNKKNLENTFIIITTIVNDMGLEIKDNHQLNRFDWIDTDGTRKGVPLDFMGFLFYRDKTALRESIAHRISNSATRISMKPQPTIHDCRKMVSYMGYYKHSDTYTFFNEHVFSKVSIPRMKKYIKAYDLKLRKQINAPKRDLKNSILDVSCPDELLEEDVA